MKYNNTIGLVAGLSGALAVAFGAFGAHAAEAFLEASGRAGTYETAVKYHFYHTLALLLIGWAYQQTPHKYYQWAANAMALGILVFSGSLYTLCFTGITILGAVTPIGGLLFIVGWLLLALGAKATKKG